MQYIKGSVFAPQPRPPRSEEVEHLSQSRGKLFLATHHAFIAYYFKVHLRDRRGVKFT